MPRKLDKHEIVSVAKIDAGVTNRFNFAWLDCTVETTVKLSKDTKDITLRVGDHIFKIDAPGEAYQCNAKIKYGSSGKKALVNHLTTAKHMEHVKMSLTSQTLGSYGLSVSCFFPFIFDTQNLCVYWVRICVVGCVKNIEFAWLVEAVRPGP